jgi:hypothetical protein
LASTERKAFSMATSAASRASNLPTSRAERLTQPEPRPSSVRTVQVKSSEVATWWPNSPFE